MEKSNKKLKFKLKAQVSSSRLRVEGYGLWVMGYGLWVKGDFFRIRIDWNRFEHFWVTRLPLRLRSG
jgi:hypothetical protein